MIKRVYLFFIGLTVTLNVFATTPLEVQSQASKDLQGACFAMFSYPRHVGGQPTPMFVGSKGYQYWPASLQFKAFAIGYGSNNVQVCAFSSMAKLAKNSSQESAIFNALDECNKLGKGTCVVYAIEDHQIIYNKEAHADKVAKGKLRAGADKKNGWKDEVEENKLIEMQQAAQRERESSKNVNETSIKLKQRITLQINNSQPNADGDVSINIETNADTASLMINGEEQGGRPDGKYSIKRVARAGQETRFEIYAKDVYGNTDTKSITVSRTVVESKVTYEQLNPDRIKRQPERDAVAVIIGISNYKSLPKAEFAKDDAQVFYDYAIRALGVKPGNIKLLMDEQADAEEIYTAFKTWLPARVKSTTDVYVFYSGHGLPTQDGSGLYWLPQRANRDLISKTGILLAEVNSDIQATKPKSVTIFMDACYSGQARGGETLVASARPIALKSQPTTFPSNFTVISASQADQISSSSPELQHGIFSYYLMRGMEGEADLNKDGKITLNETQAYLSENVGRHARIMNRQQEPQVIGDGARVLVGR